MKKKIIFIPVLSLLFQFISPIATYATDDFSTSENQVIKATSSNDTPQSNDPYGPNYITPNSMTTIDGITYRLNSPQNGLASAVSYSGAATDISIPSTIQYSTYTFTVDTIEANAFSSKNLTSVQLSEGLTWIGSSAFANNALTEIHLPSSLNVIFDFAFFNQNPGLKDITGGENVATIMPQAFSANSLTDISTFTNITALNQGFVSQVINFDGGPTDTIQLVSNNVNDPAKVDPSEFYSVTYQGNKTLITLNNPTNKGTINFRTGGSDFMGVINYNFLVPTITGEDFTMTVGDAQPTAADFNASATDKEGNAIAVTADFSTVDFTKAGAYDVVLTAADGQTKTVKLTIKENKQTIAGSDYSMYVGDKEATVADFNTSATDKDGNSIAVTANLSGIDFTKAGTSDVVLTAADGQTKTVKLTIKENKQSITGSDYSMYVGDKEATVADFNASATDKDGNSIAVTADLSGIDFTKAGAYDVVLTATDGQTKTVKLTILAKEIVPTIDVTDKTMYVGDTLTKEDVLAWATFNHAEGLVQGFEVVGTKIPVSADDKLTTAGSYTIKYYVQGKTRATGENLAEKEITLTVLEKKVDPTTPTDPAKTIGSGTLPVTSTATSGKDLPSTGEQSSPLFYFVGASMMIGASGLYLWMRKVRRN